MITYLIVLANMMAQAYGAGTYVRGETLDGNVMRIEEYGQESHTVVTTFIIFSMSLLAMMFRRL